MALKPCRECKREISSRAKVCPGCGLKRPHDLAIQHGLNQVAAACFKIGALLVVFGLLVSMCGV